jgi:hypothetical protein
MIAPLSLHDYLIVTAALLRSEKLHLTRLYDFPGLRACAGRFSAWPAAG